MPTSTLIQKLNKYALSRQQTKKNDNKPQSAIEQLNQAQNEWLKGKGLEFFCKELTHRHRKAIDASNGSSAFVPPSFVTEQLSGIETIHLIEYNSHVPTADFMESAEKYFREIGVIDAKTHIYENVYFASSSEDYVAMVGHGTTDLYNRSLRTILKTKGDVIIITEPTYGLFVEPILDKGGEIATLPLNKKNLYKPNPKELETLISSTNKEKKQQYRDTVRITKKLLHTLSKKSRKNHLKQVFLNIDNLSKIAKDSVQNDTFSHVDEAVAQYNQSLRDCLSKFYDGDKLRQWVEKLTLPLCPRVRGYLNINPHMPMGTICDQDEIDALASTIDKFDDLTVIDDLTYFQLTMPPYKGTPGTFAKSVLKHKTVILYGPSKPFGMAGIRTAICLGNKSYILPITKDVFYEVNTTSIYSDTALHAVFKMDPEERNEYLTENNEDYALRRDFTIALIQGTKNISPEQVTKIKAKLTSLGVKKDEQEKLLLGIKDLSVVLTPESGFFLLIDFSKYKGKYFGNVQLNTGSDFRNALYCFTNLDTISGEMSLYSKEPVIRFSCSIDEGDILESIYRIKAVLDLCQDKPYASLTEKSVGDKALEKKPKTFTPKFKAKAKEPNIPNIASKSSQRKRTMTMRNADFVWG